MTILTDQRELFSSGNARHALAKDWSRFDIPELKEKLLRVGPMAKRSDGEFDLDKFRLVVVSLSMELSRRGVAPRWQGLVRWKLASDESAGSVDPVLKRAVQEDHVLLDLYWLWNQHRKQINAKIPKWQRLFTADEFDLVLALDVAAVKRGPGRKVMELRLSDWQQIGCLALIRKRARDVIDKAAKKYRRVYATELESLEGIRNLKAEKCKQSALDRANTYLAWEVVSKTLGPCSKTGSTRYQAITDAVLMVWGKRTDRANVRRTLTRMFRG